MEPSDGRHQRDVVGTASLGPTIVRTLACVLSGFAVLCAPAHGAPRVTLTPATPAPSAVPGCPSGSHADAAASLQPVDAVFVEDDSGSMAGPRGSDPQARRYSAAKLAVRFLRGLTPGVCNRIAVVHFGSRVSTARELALVPEPTSRAALQRSLLPGLSLGATHYGPALRRAGHLFGPAPILGRLRVVFLITDGKPNQPGVSAAREIGDIKSAVAGLGGAALHVLVIDRHGRFGAEERAMWDRLGAKTVDRLTGAWAGQLDRALTRAIADDLGISDEAERSISPGVDASIDVPPLRQEFVVTGFALHRGAAVSLIAPGGRVARTLRGPLAIAHIPAPRPGRWHLRAVGNAPVRITSRLLAPRLRLDVAANPWPLGRPLVITLRYGTRAQQRAATADLRITGSAGTDISRRLVPASLAATVAPDRAIILSRPGTYRASAVVRVDGVPVARASLPAIRITAKPYLAVTSATVDARHGLSVPLQLRLGSSPVDARQVLANDPRGVAHAVVAHRGGVERLSVKWLRGSAFVVTSKYRPEDGERLSLGVTLGARTRNGADVTDMLVAAVRAEPTAGDLAADGRGRIALFVALLAAAVLLGFAGWLLALPRMTGRVTVAGTDVRVDGQRLVRVRGESLRASTWIIGARRRRRRVGHELQVGLLPTPWAKCSKARGGSSPRPRSTGGS
ncbi:MAG: von Willebrand factor type domain [Solirubrobacteraceae bacterium]|jgi:hypothetical protein|nr:von Willebrand factor type domain [Solirubrobacteraceae bacterium]